MTLCCPDWLPNPARTTNSRCAERDSHSAQRTVHTPYKWHAATSPHNIKRNSFLPNFNLNITQLGSNESSLMMVVERNTWKKANVNFHVNFKTLSSLIKSAFVGLFMNCIALHHIIITYLSLLMPSCYFFTTLK